MKNGYYETTADLARGLMTDARSADSTFKALMGQLCHKIEDAAKEGASDLLWCSFSPSQGVPVGTRVCVQYAPDAHARMAVDALLRLGFDVKEIDLVHGRSWRISW